MLAGRLQVLADRQEVDAGGPHVVHHLHYFFLRLAKADHEAGFGELVRVTIFHLLQQAQRVEIPRARADRQVKTRHRFEVVIEHIRLRVDHTGFPAILAQEVRRQNLDCGAGRCGADGLDRVHEMHRPTVDQVIAVNRRDHHVLEAHFGNRFGHTARFVLVHTSRRLAGRDVAEAASAGADLAQNHHRGVFLVPALPDIRAAGLFAHRHEALGFHDFPRFGITFGSRRLDADPVRLALYRAIRTRLFFRVAQTGRFALEINQVCHRRNMASPAPELK